jgi:hypothetical protein
MILKFNRAKVQELMDAELAREPGRVPYTGAGWDTPEKRAHGLNLVGDQGVYLVCNSPRVDGRSPSKSGDIAYAANCDPNRMAFEDWYEVKNRSFGGDDGVEFIPADNIRAWLDNTQAPMARIDIGPKRFALCPSFTRQSHGKKRDLGQAAEQEPAIAP